MITTPMIPQIRLTDDAEGIFRHLGENDEPLVVSLDGRPTVVIQNYERYEKTQRGIELWKILSHRIREAEQGMLTIEEAFEEIETKIDG